ncbi:MAG TPA: cytochrome c oxidase subunit II [Bryobacteraceae bacterium]|nr:cytochrome c oxidase subunit II [Bryobacteraceae bacterium]
MIAAGPVFSPHSPQTEAIEGVFSVVLIIAVVVFAVVASGVTYCSLRFRGRDGAPEPRQRFGSRGLEILWTVVPLLVMTGLFVITVRAMVTIDAPQASGQKPDLTVRGRQWWWDARYPNGAVATGDIHIPVGRRLLVLVESTDVIHDFWAPELERKMDAVPGRPSYIWLEADAPGTYSGACSEFCGADHAWMRFRVIAEPDASYDAWLQHQMEPPPVPTGAAADGARLFRSKKCADCHGIASAVTAANPDRGPDLSHLASRELLGGGIQRNTPANLTIWLTDPQAAKPGNHMPDTPLTTNERTALLAYLESLR